MIQRACTGRISRALLLCVRHQQTAARYRCYSTGRIPPESADDVVITFAKRTALTRAKKGLFSHTSSDRLLRSTLEAALRDCGVDAHLVLDIIVGTCHPPSPCYEARAAALAAGFPETTGVQTVNRLCGSGLMAMRHVSDSIRAGDIDVGLAVGYESMSSHPRPTPVFSDEKILSTNASLDCSKPMGWTSEILALDYGVSREEQDQFGLMSHQRASAAQRNGHFDSQIMPISTRAPIDRINPNSELEDVVVEQDDGIRHSLTLGDMISAKPAFKGVGDERSTGPNSSQVTDGAAVALLMRRAKAQELELKPIATHLGTSVVGVQPRVMGVGPVYAIPALLQRKGLSMEDIDLFEINEAFGSMYAYCVKTLNIPLEKVNVNGGAIALGHPLGATGVRQVVTGIHEILRQRSHAESDIKNRRSLLCTSMCIGSGMGAAALFAVP